MSRPAEDQKSIFISVGSTQFSLLIESVLKPSFIELCLKNNYKKLILQYGQSRTSNKAAASYCNEETAVAEALGMEVLAYAYLPDLTPHILCSDLIICHSGAGTLLECLRAGKPIVAVTNDFLMGGHQKELAAQLASDNYILSLPCSRLDDLFLSQTPDQFPETSREKISRLQLYLKTRRLWPKANPEPFYKLLSELVLSP